ncbi:LOW QUALITY PROTEIN: kinesin-like protein KIF14, partial [Oncorhynchus kisutch]|uniref:LOW QUALITY PROTEIN: kinesin-like protein KIF14 n=1 Tax=Oncorhynchus kisutch TaxID=8019 RepID=UPI0012DD6E68
QCNLCGSLLLELKAEVEKLRAAQMSSQCNEPEKMGLFQQEILALKSQLTQQEREMAEAHRAWREKLEQAEKHKREETEELQEAGVTFAVDNRLPNLMNLNEDPQLSEMLLYMIKEGQTKVGQHKSKSPHDIQLSGALIADHHCVVSNVNGEVGITPMENAFVNGNLVSDTTVLRLGSRVILGGDHYFRFNHPAEVQSGKRVSCWMGAGDGQKDFEFAKNKLLSAQRAQLEEEIEEAHLKAKEEMMQGIQVAKEMAQEELSDQKARYENRIKALLERTGTSTMALPTKCEEESERKWHWEMDQQQVTSKMEELQSAKVELEQEVDTHKTRLRLHMEAQATRRAMAGHGVRQAKVVEALEAEKWKIDKDLEEMQTTAVERKQDSEKRGTAAPLKMTTCFTTPMMSGSKIYLPPQPPPPFHAEGLLGVAKPPSLHPSSSDSVLPGICKDLIGQTVGRLRECHSHEESMADRPTSDLCCVYTAVTTISDLYDGLDVDSQENMFEAETQSQLVKATSAIQRAVFITMQWGTSVDPGTGTLYINAEELRPQVKRMGGYFQLHIQVKQDPKSREREATFSFTSRLNKTPSQENGRLLSASHPG